jgi:hypothetical protein
MTVLSRIRQIAFLVLLVAVIVPIGPVSAQDACTEFGPCDSCDTGPGHCYLWEGGSCAQYSECQYAGFCQWPNGSVRICNCGACRMD